RRSVSMSCAGAPVPCLDACSRLFQRHSAPKRGSAAPKPGGRPLASLMAAAVRGRGVPMDRNQQGETLTRPVPDARAAITPAQPAKRSFIRVVEIWHPTPDGKQLQFLDGYYGPLDEFRAASETMRFGFDEGLPGKAWASGHPIILKQFANSYFK